MSSPSNPLAPVLSRTITRIFEANPPASPLPEHVVEAPPGTPATNTESDNDTHHHEDMPPRTPHTVSLEQYSTESHDSRDSGRRKGRKRGKKGARSLIGSFHPSIVLENSGSVARDHLALERTFLAYIRTSLLLASSGVALVQLFAVASANATVSATLDHVRQFARPLGATMVVFGLIILLLGVRRYFLIQTSLTQGKFPITRFSIAGISIVTAVIIIIVFGVLVSSRSK